MNVSMKVDLVQWFSTFFRPWTIFSNKKSDGPLLYADTS